MRKMKKPPPITPVSYHDEIFLWLGHFVSLYTSLEQAVHMIFYKYSGLKDEAGRAISGGMRLGDVMAMTKRLVVARGLDQQIYDDLDRLYGSVSEFSTYRDKVIHRQWHPDDDSKEVHILNLVSAKSSLSFEEYKVTAEELRKKYREMQFLIVALATHTLTKKQWKHYRQKGYAASPAPWFEKPGPPAKSPQPSRKDAR